MVPNHQPVIIRTIRWFHLISHKLIIIIHHVHRTIYGPKSVATCCILRQPSTGRSIFGSSEALWARFQGTDLPASNVAGKNPWVFPNQWLRNNGKICAMIHCPTDLTTDSRLGWAQPFGSQVDVEVLKCGNLPIET